MFEDDIHPEKPEKKRFYKGNLLGWKNSFTLNSHKRGQVAPALNCILSLYPE